MKSVGKRKENKDVLDSEFMNPKTPFIVINKFDGVVKAIFLVKELEWKLFLHDFLTDIFTANACSQRSVHLGGDRRSALHKPKKES